MPHHSTFAGFAWPPHGGMFVVAAGMFVLGVAAGTAARPALAPGAAAAVAPAVKPIEGAEPAPADLGSARFEARLVYPADVVRIIDGDTFEARVRVWPGVATDTKVRLRGIDAPELHARCDDERVRAEAGSPFRASGSTNMADASMLRSRLAAPPTCPPRFSMAASRAAMPAAGAAAGADRPRRPLTAPPPWCRRRPGCRGRKRPH